MFTVKVIKHWNRLPRESVDSSSLKEFKTQLNTVLSSALQLTLKQEGWTRQFLELPFNLNNFVFL